LFRIDHLATRMRRNAEGLLVLAGDQPGRTWTEPVPMVDVLRGSVAEVIDYARIRVACSSRVALQGHAVADVIHLIAELAENATTYSPPDSPVRIWGTEVVRGFAVEVEDRGLGIPAGMTARLNAALSDPPPFNPAESAHLGLYVAARLAQRHGVGITLSDSPYGGTTAIVLIPHGLIVSDGHPLRGQAPDTGPHAFAASGQASREPVRSGAALSGRHASRDIPLRVSVPDTRAPVPGGFGRPSPADSPVSHAADAGTPAGVTLTGAEFQLPRRIRQANLPPHLLKPQTPRRAAAPMPADGLPTEEIRAVFADIQDGMERGNRENLVPGGRGEARNGSWEPGGARPALWAVPTSERSTGDNGRRH
jgi:anti-sigma regulatory factor (Ser/Thr protein kinase)